VLAYRNQLWTNDRVLVGLSGVHVSPVPPGDGARQRCSKEEDGRWLRRGWGSGSVAAGPTTNDPLVMPNGKKKGVRSGRKLSGNTE
jgi:hypothetical protein